MNWSSVSSTAASAATTASRGAALPSVATDCTDRCNSFSAVSNASGFGAAVMLRNTRARGRSAGFSTTAIAVPGAGAGTGTGAGADAGAGTDAGATGAMRSTRVRIAVWSRCRRRFATSASNATAMKPMLSCAPIPSRTSRPVGGTADEFRLDWAAARAPLSCAKVMNVPAGVVSRVDIVPAPLRVFRNWPANWNARQAQEDRSVRYVTSPSMRGAGRATSGSRPRRPGSSRGYGLRADTRNPDRSSARRDCGRAPRG